jgi:predicted nucleotidyltransferase
VAHPREADTAALIAALHEAGVRFIVVGGTAAQLHGSTLGTLDLDIVHQRDPENVAKLLDVLNQLDAFDRHDLTIRRLKPTAEQLGGRAQINLSTILGPLDLLCELQPGQGYEELLPHSEVMHDEGVEIRVVDLPTLIEINARVGRAKDKLVVAELIAILEERQR